MLSATGHRPTFYPTFLFRNKRMAEKRQRQVRLFLDIRDIIPTTKWNVTGEGVMYERMLNKQAMPTIEGMMAFCGKNAGRFPLLNQWLTFHFAAEQKAVFPMAIIMIGELLTKPKRN